MSIKNRASRLLAALGVVAAALGCSADDDVCRIGLVMRAPQGLLDDAASVELRVIDSDAATCLDTGVVEGNPTGPDVQTFALSREGCSSGMTWCRTITLTRDGSTKIFGVVARDAARQILGQGCTTAVINQDPLEVTIQVQRYNPPKCCGNAVLEAGEQCDGGPGSGPCSGNLGGEGCDGMDENPVCWCDCTAREILLSIDNPSEPFLTTGAPGSKTDLALAFAGSSGDTALALRAVFVDHDNTFGYAPDINLRMLQGNLLPFEAASPLSKQLRLPQCGSVQEPEGRISSQLSPELAMIRADVTAVVFGDARMGVVRHDIFLSQQLPWGCADNDPVKVNFARNDTCLFPDIARGPDSVALVVWSDQGQVRAREWRFDGTAAGQVRPVDGDLLIADHDLGTRPRVSGWSTDGGTSDWVITYAHQGNVFVRTVQAQTLAVRDAVQVNVAGGAVDPDVAAMYNNGRYVVVWHAGEDIYFQRHDGAGTPIPGDQEQPLTMNSSPAAFPVVAPGPYGAFYAVAWQAADGTIWGRFLGALTGFGYNSVTGQNDDFLASHAGVTDGVRSRPSIAIGGSSPGYVVIGWQDEAAAHPGVYVRRFPMPQ